MRLLDRDLRWVLVSRYESKSPVTDGGGRLTGRYEVSRSEPVAALASVSAARGSALDSVFGQSLDYDRTVLVDDPQFEIDEAAVLWIDCIDGSGAMPPDAGQAWDYAVTRVARTPGLTAIAVKRVERP